MKRLLALFAVITFCTPPFISAYAETAPISMTITSLPDKIDPNDDFFIDIKLENIGKKPLPLGRYRTLICNISDYEVHVKDDSGKILTHRTDLRHPDQLGSFIETAFLTLQPHDFFVDRLVLDDLFDLSKPGRYTVEIDRKLPPEWGGWELHSNQITITIPG